VPTFACGDVTEAFTARPCPSSTATDAEEAMNSLRIRACALVAATVLAGGVDAQSLGDPNGGLAPPPASAAAPRASQPAASSQAPTGAPAARVCADCGVVQSIRYVEQQGEASGVGAVAGGVLGGVLGHQIGSGRGNTAATIVGAGAGAYAGHQVEKNRNRKSSWIVAVRMDDGRTRSLTYSAQPSVREGERVKLVDGGKRLALLAN
jgi:outer membrane lipoprotein SlyB